MEGIEAEVGDAPYQQLDALDDVEGRDAERGKHDADDDGQQDQPDYGAPDAVAEELASIHGLPPKLAGGALAPDLALA